MIWMSKAIEWFDRHFPFVISKKEDSRRDSLENRLRETAKFPSDRWAATELEQERVERILMCVASVFDWPNCHFLPDDPLSLVLLEDVNDFGGAEFVLEVQSRFGAAIDEQELRELVTREGNLAHLVQLISQRARTS